MCGIAGIWNREGEAVSSSSLQAMAHSLEHRGPDGEGIWTHGGIGFAHRRLSIIDLSPNASQPFFSSDGRYILVFNGEIYNYKELRNEYFSDHVFVSYSDTEVLLHMLIQFGSDATAKLRGMFACAFFDTQEKELLLVCDSFGKKPIYYTWVGNIFLFASEPKALFASGFVRPQVDYHIISSYLQREYMPIPSTGYIGICVLSSGHWMKVGTSSIRISRWWKPEVAPKHTISFEKVAARFDDLLGQAVERRMVADVPVGIFLSGGLDSSTIAWYMRRSNPNADVHSCSVTFQEHSFNESSYAQMVANVLRTTHHELIFTRRTMQNVLQELIPLIDIPFADASLLPTYAISRLARSYMKVALGGDGADELLGGYGTFDAYEAAAALSWIPKDVWRGLGKVLAYTLPVSHTYFSLDFRIKSFLRGAPFQDPENLAVWLGACTAEEVRALMEHHAVLPCISDSIRKTKNHPFDRASLLHIRGYLENDILVKFDRATMAASLEARTPFLDVDLVDFVLKLPVSYKRHKKILKHVMKSRLPREILNRKKQGFGIPLGAWLMQEDSLARHVLTEQRVAEVGLFKYSAISNILRDHEYGKRDYRKKIWTLVMFQLWYEYWILGQKDVASLV